mgnify:CR=1 FL=1
MKTTAVRLYGKNDLRLESFELPPIKDDEILAKVISDSLCMSSYKAAIQGADHKRVPDDVAQNPTIIGHEFCGEIVATGEGVEGYTPGDKVAADACQHCGQAAAHDQFGVPGRQRGRHLAAVLGPLVLVLHGDVANHVSVCHLRPALGSVVGSTQCSD